MKKKQDNDAKSESASDILTHFMEEQSMRKTPERYAILDVVMQMDGHHSADEILEMMPANFHVSRASIYNTLHLLLECGLVKAHQINGIVLYEKAYGMAHHHHYICTGCNKIWDLYDEELDRTISKVKTAKFKKINCSTYIYGLCNLCLAKLARMKKKMEKEKIANMTREEIRFARIDEELAKAAEWLR